MRGGFAFSIGVHALILFLVIFGLPYFRPKPKELPPMISVDVVDMSKQATTNKISPANKVEKTVQEDTPPPAPKPPPQSQPTPEPPKPQPEPPQPQPKEPIDTAIPKLAAVDQKVSEVKLPDESLKRPMKPLPELADLPTRPAEIAAPQKVELKRPQPKAPAPSFDSVLKNLEKMKPQDQPSNQPPQPTKAPSRPQTGALAQLSDKLTRSDEDALRQQLAQCWNIPAGVKDAQNLVVELDVVVNPDRTVAAVQVNDQARMASDPAFRTAAMSAVRALRMPQCTPLALPPEKYEEWKTMTLRFDPKEMLGQ